MERRIQSATETALKAPTQHYDLTLYEAARAVIAFDGDFGRAQCLSPSPTQVALGRMPDIGGDVSHDENDSAIFSVKFMGLAGRRGAQARAGSVGHMGGRGGGRG